MRVIKSVILVAFFSISFPAILAAAPEVKVIPSRASVQKGSSFEIRVEIAAREDMSGISVSPLVPSGFRLHGVPSHGIEVADNDVVHLSRLKSESSIAIVFKGETPAVIGRSGVSTAEGKVFGFNISYSQGGDMAQGSNSQFVSTTIQYTTSIGIYLVAGMIGAMLGHLIKTGIKKREDLSKTMGFSGGLKGTGAALKELLGTNLTGLITILIVSFGAMIVLAKDGVPVAGHMQAMALGIGLAVLTDDQLLSKFTGGK